MTRPLQRLWESARLGDERARLLLQAQTAAGDGALDEQLVRLMVWVGTRLHSETTHSLVYNPVEILLSGLAWCDQMVIVFAWLVHELLGLSSRQVALHHTNGRDGHTVAEVFYGGGWHLYDVHSEHMVVYRDPVDGHVLSRDEIVAMPSVVRNEAHWWRGEDEVGKEGFYAPESAHDEWPCLPSALGD